MLNTTFYFIVKLDIFPFISPSDIVSIGLVILENISMCDVTLCHLIPMKIISILKVSTYIITNIVFSKLQLFNIYHGGCNQSTPRKKSINLRKSVTNFYHIKKKQISLCWCFVWTWWNVLNNFLFSFKICHKTIHSMFKIMNIIFQNIAHLHRFSLLLDHYIWLYSSLCI